MRSPQPNVPVAPGRRPLVGHLIPLLTRPMPFLEGLAELSPIVRIHLWRRPVYVLTTPELVRRVLLSDAAAFEKGFIYDKARSLLGNGLFLSEGDFHRQQRRLLQPAFHRDRLIEYVDGISRLAQRSVAAWDPGRPLDLSARMHEISRDAVMEALFAARLDPDQENRVQQAVPIVLRGFVQRALYPSSLLEKIPVPANRRFDAAVRDLRELIDDLVARAEYNPTAEGGLLSRLRYAPGEGASPVICPRQLRDEAVSVLLAGTETSATTLTWLFYELARDPDLQEALRTEVNNHAGSSSMLTWFDLERLDHTKRALNETLRLHTPNWILMRRTTTEIELDGTRLAPGSEVLFSLTALHRDRDRYPNPKRFDADRWLDTGGHRSFIPFGAGAHKCIGDAFAWTEMLVIAATVLARWRIRLLHGSVSEIATSATIRPRRLHITVEPVDSGLPMERR